MKTRFEEIVNVNAIGGMDQKKIQDLMLRAINGEKINVDSFTTPTKNEILKLAQAENLKPATKNDENVLVLAIDMQNDFMDNGELAVPGSFKDVENFTRFIYNNMDKISRIAVSLDTHQPHQIFHPTWWIDKNNNHPDPFTVITTKDLDEGKYEAVIEPGKSREYVENLEKIAKKPLCIWTYHCIEGTHGAALEDQFANMVYFHSIAKKSVTQRLVKGTDPLSEMYGIIKPEYDRQGYINMDFLNALEKYDKIIVGGEAKSHCVLESVRQILEFYEDRPEITSKVYILEDCMSSIPGFEDATEQTFNEFKKQYKINIVKSSDLVL